MGALQFQSLTAPSWDRLDLTLDWRNMGGSNFSLGLFANNVTDRRAIIAGGTTSAGFGINSAFYSPPRMFGVKLSVGLGSESRK
jgi:outer membrane receptor protein involved in Fe transport